jgi:hypothetical protein
MELKKLDEDSTRVNEFLKSLDPNTSQQLHHFLFSMGSGNFSLTDSEICERHSYSSNEIIAYLKKHLPLAEEMAHEGIPTNKLHLREYGGVIVVFDEYGSSPRIDNRYPLIDNVYTRLYTAFTKAKKRGFKGEMVFVRYSNPLK